eukprot:Tamp_27964.p1 GENE.Tamp_27964~~Tamp_27964.p1  ORF type:complete len:175 (+),score=21.71 Tamp_27964:250-774(+)
MHYKLTLGVDFALKVLHRPQSVVRLQLRDIAGQEKAGTMTRVYYRDATAAVVVFDVTRHVTLDSVSVWKKDIDSKLQLPDGRQIPAVLLANKCDLEADKNMTEEVLNELVASDRFIAWFLTSAKDDKNIAEAFNFLVDRAIADYEATRRIDSEARSRHTIQLGDDRRPARKCAC